MANIQVRGADGLTYVYLWAEGQGTEIDPFKSKYLVEQSGNWAVEVTNLPSTYTMEGSVVVSNYADLITVLRAESLDVNINNLPSTYNVDANVNVDNLPASFGATQIGDWVVSIANPTSVNGLATEAKQDELINKLPAGLTVIDGKLIVNAEVPEVLVIDANVTVDNLPTSFSATQEGNWGVTVLNPLDASGLATKANQESILAKLPEGLSVTNGKLNVDTGIELPETFVVDASVTLEDLPTSFGATQSGSWTVDTGLSQPLTDTQLRASAVTTSVTNYSDLAAILANTRLQADIKNNVSVISDFELDKTGLSTDLNQVITNSTLASIDNKTPALSSGSVPVVLSSEQITALTPPNTVAISGTVRNNPTAASTPTLTNVASSAASVTLVVANTNRKTLIIVNDSTAALYLKFDASAASTTSYSWVLAPIANGIPSILSLSGDDYAGEVRGIWSNANGFARITEVV